MKPKIVIAYPGFGDLEVEKQFEDHKFEDSFQSPNEWIKP